MFPEGLLMEHKVDNAAKPMNSNKKYKDLRAVVDICRIS